MTLFGWTIKILTQLLDDFLSQYLPGTCSTSTRQNVIEMTWMSPSPNVVYSSLLRDKRIETVAWSCCLSTTLLTASFPTGRYSHLRLHSSAWRIMANGNLFWWLQKSSSNITNRGHPSILYHGFLPLILELEHAEDVGGRGGPGRVRGGISRTPSPTFPALQHLEREKCCGGSDPNLSCQSQD